MNLNCAPDNIYSFLQTKIEFVGFILVKSDEEQEQIDDVDELGSNINTVYHKRTCDNFKVMQ